MDRRRNPRHRKTRRRLYAAALAVVILFTFWQLYELLRFKQQVVTQHPGVARPWDR